MKLIFDREVMMAAEKEEGFDYQESLEQAEKGTGVKKEILDWASQIDGKEVTGVGPKGELFCGKFMVRKEWCRVDENLVR